MSHGISRSTNLELKAQLRTPREIRLAGDRPSQSSRDKHQRVKAEGSLLSFVMAMPRAKGWRVFDKRHDDAKDGTKGTVAPTDGVRA